MPASSSFRLEIRYFRPTRGFQSPGSAFVLPIHRSSGAVQRNACLQWVYLWTCTYTDSFCTPSMMTGTATNNQRGRTIFTLTPAQPPISSNFTLGDIYQPLAPGHRKKIDEITDFMFRKKIRITGVQETKLNPRCTLTSSDDYRIIQRDRTGKGELAFNLHKSVATIQLPFRESSILTLRQ